MQALQAYGSESSGSESDSGSGEEDDARAAKRSRRSLTPPPPRVVLPPPDAFLQAFGACAATRMPRHQALRRALHTAGSSADAEKDPHEGRVRSFELAEGFFPVHVFVPLTPEGGAAAALAAFVGAACSAAPSGQLRPCAPVATAGGAAPLHLSLSRTLPVSRAKLGSLTDALRAALKRAPPPAWLPLRHPCSLVNDARTRTFLCLEAVPSGASPQLAAFGAAIAAVDAAFARHDLPPFYSPPRAHASLAWALGDVAAVADAAAAAAAAAGAPPPDWRAALPRVEMAVGARVVAIWPPDTTKRAGQNTERLF